MRKQEILDRINEIIVEEKGKALQSTDLFKNAELDSLGTAIVLITIDAEFFIFKGMTEEEAWASIDIPTITMRDLVNKCKLSITGT